MCGVGCVRYRYTSTIQCVEYTKVNSPQSARYHYELSASSHTHTLLVLHMCVLYDSTVVQYCKEIIKLRESNNAVQCWTEFGPVFGSIDELSCGGNITICARAIIHTNGASTELHMLRRAGTHTHM